MFLFGLAACMRLPLMHPCFAMLAGSIYHMRLPLMRPCSRCLLDPSITCAYPAHVPPCSRCLLDPSITSGFRYLGCWGCRLESTANSAVYQQTEKHDYLQVLHSLATGIWTSASYGLQFYRGCWAGNDWTAATRIVLLLRLQPRSVRVTAGTRV